MKNSTIVAQHLIDAWIKVCAFVFRFGTERNDQNNSQKEALNLSLSINNSYETDHNIYFEYFDRDVYNNVISIYQDGFRTPKRSYADKIYRNNGVNQLDEIAKVLARDPLSKSATIVLSDPKKDRFHYPCIMDINFKIRDERLIMTVIFKSNDVAKKFIPDIFSLSRIHARLSQKLQVARGAINVLIMSAQVYASDYQTIQKLVAKKHTITYFNEEKTIENWNKEAALWDENIRKPDHYVNIEDGYNRFLKFINQIFEKNKLRRRDSCLDSGCGTGIIAKLLKHYSDNVYAIDIADQMIVEAKKKVKDVKFILANCLDLPFPDHFFKIVASRGVLISHVGKRYSELFVQEAHRVLKTKGLFVFDFITQFNKDETKKKRKKTSLNKKTISLMLERNGFRVIEFSGENTNRVNTVFCLKK